MIQPNRDNQEKQGWWSSIRNAIGSVFESLRPNTPQLQFVRSPNDTITDLNRSFQQVLLEYNQQLIESDENLEVQIEFEPLMSEPIGVEQPELVMASSKVDLLKAVQNTNTVMTLVSSVSVLEPGGLDRVDGIEIKNQGLIDSGAERTIIEDTRNPENPRTYNLDTFTDTGTMHLSNNYRTLFTAESTGQIIVNDLDDPFKGLVEVIETVDNAVFRELLGISQPPAPEQTMQAAQPKIKPEEVSVSRKNSDLEL